MKILQVINSLSVGGAEKLIIEFVPLLKDKGHKIDVLILKNSDSHLNIQLIEQGITVLSLNGKNVYNPFLIFKLVKYLTHYDIIHAHLFPSQYWTIFAKLISFSKAKFITTEHNTFNRRRNHFILKYVDKFIYSHYDKIITVSNKAYNALCEYLRCSQNIVCVPNGVNIKKISDSSPYLKYEMLEIENDCVLLVMVASFRAAKDQDTVIRSLNQLPDKYHLAFVGEGERRCICESLVRELGLQKRVHFLGLRSDVGQILKTADIIILSSHWEGLSLSSIEGMAANKPFIASDVMGLTEIVKGAGLLFKEEDYNELFELINRLINEKDFYNNIAELCYQRSLRYDIDRMVYEYELIYSSLKK
jgi:glycosyltransferase involved in cell wall biosynthesis